MAVSMARRWVVARETTMGEPTDGQWEMPTVGCSAGWLVWWWVDSTADERVSTWAAHWGRTAAGD